MKAKVVNVVGWIALMVVVNYVLDAIRQPTLQPRLPPILFGVATGLIIGLLMTKNPKRNQSTTGR